MALVTIEEVTPFMHQNAATAAAASFATYEEQARLIVVEHSGITLPTGTRSASLNWTVLPMAYIIEHMCLSSMANKGKEYAEVVEHKYEVAINICKARAKNSITRTGTIEGLYQ